MPRGMGAWVFMARKACTTPFPALKPNPSRSFLSGGRGDYPKEFCESESVEPAQISMTTFTVSVKREQQIKAYQRTSGWQLHTIRLQGGALRQAERPPYQAILKDNLCYTY